jgi:arylsulfatase A-like enzyme
MSFASTLRLLLAAWLAAALAACAAVPPQIQPRVVVVLVVDGLPQRQVLAYRDQLAPDGFARFLDRGAWFSQAFYGHAHTVTAAGHAAILTGAYPHRTGIIGNEWRDQNTGAGVYNTADLAATYIGQRTDPRTDGTSPRNLKAETVGDVLRRAEPRSKVIAVSGKDRGAILLAGKAGTAYMYMDDTGAFASSTYYMARHPPWVDAFNAARPADRYFKTEWQPLLPDDAYARSLPDGQPWFGRPGERFPKTMIGEPGQAAPGPSYYSTLLPSPYIDELTLEFARDAIANEQLGRNQATDILALSLSGHDYVNHSWSAESRFSQDHFLRLDRMLQDFFRHLDQVVGKDNYVAVLTADHGFTPAPEYARAQGLDAGRIAWGPVLARVNAGLAQRFGPGRWAIGNSASSLLLNRQLIAQNGMDADTVADEARRLLLAEPGIGLAYTRRELLSGSRAGEPFFAALRKAWHPDVSGEVQYAPNPNWVFGSAGATHGSPHPADTQVPILMYGPAWVKAGRVDARVEVVDIAPTLARLLQVPPPAAAEGRPLPLP